MKVSLVPIDETNREAEMMQFFEKHDYTICGTFEDYPTGHRRCQLQKQL